MAKAEVRKPAAKPAAPAQSRAVATTAPQALVLVQDEVPEHLKAAMASKRGSENVGTEDLVIPRLEVVQQLSKALEPGHAMFIEGAKQGDLINSVTRKVYGNFVHVVNVHYSKQFLVWKDIKKGGGFFGSFPDPEQATARANEEGGVGEKTGIEIIDTPVHLCLIVDRDTGSVDEIMVSMPRTKAKISRGWNSMIRLAQGDRFMRVYKIQTQQEEKNGNKYFNFAVAACGFPAPALYKAAESLFKQISDPNAKKRVMDVKDFDPGQPGGDDPEM